MDGGRKQDMTTVKGRGGYEEITGTDVALDWGDIEHVGRCSLTESQQRCVKECLVTYGNEAAREVDDPTFTQIAAILINIATSGKAFRAALDRLERPDKDADYDLALDDERNGDSGYEKRARVASVEARKQMDRALRRQTSHDVRKDTRRRQDDTYREIGEWVAAAESAENDLRLHSGASSRTPNRALRKFISNVSAVYQVAGGKIAANYNKISRSWSPFIRWLHALLESLPPNLEARSAGALGALVRTMKVDDEFQPP